ncbi:hypothetical protein ABTY59_23905 [Streptomyces sp. NPDC096079]|uniref:hypothetical protein n=1 Tax=Streptomyces sp. NPDC096079 TaxID=3155820 RepID=UPI00331C6F0C
MSGTWGGTSADPADVVVPAPADAPAPAPVRGGVAARSSRLPATTGPVGSTVPPRSAPGEGDAAGPTARGPAGRSGSSSASKGFGASDAELRGPAGGPSVDQPR